MRSIEEVKWREVLKTLEKLKGKRVKVVYVETKQSEKPYNSEGILVDFNPSFVCVKAENNLIHFIATDTIVRISERFPEKR